MIKLKFILLFIFTTTFFNVKAQGLKINEVMSSNSITIYDEDGDTPDWIELYNAGTDTIDLEGFGLSDTSNLDQSWLFPAYKLHPARHLLIFASDKNRTEPPLNWETAIDLGESWKYIVPTEEPDPDWRTIGFDDSSWSEGKSGFGYGDNDDSTVVESTLSVFVRKVFNVDDPSEIKEAVLHVDYDDGFIAYINNVEVARNGFTGSGPFPFNVTSGISHEASMYSGGQPEAFFISSPENVLVPGENVIAIQVHNTSAGSSDLTLIPILSWGKTSDSSSGLSEYLELSPKSFHTNFKISSEGETIYLHNASKNILDTLFTGSLTANISIGRKIDGGDDTAYFNEPTPGDSNLTQSYDYFSGSVTFSEQGGYFNAPLELIIETTNSGDSIYYTTDGSEPTTNSNLYHDPVNLSSNSIIRARVLKANSIPGIIESQTYFFNLNHDLPVVSITTEPKNFFDYNEGIYVRGPYAETDFPYFGANFWEDWEKPVHVEMYEPDGTQAFSVNAGAKIFGGWSRGNDQKSLTIHARKSYGDGPIEYKIFSEKDLDEFSSIVLRNSGNDWNNTMLRDGLLTSLFHKSVDRQAFRPAVVYINGEYWGIMNIREKVNEHFIADNHDIDSDEVNLLELNGTPVHGDEEHYLNLFNYINSSNLSGSANYSYVKTQMDVNNFMNYQIGHIYINNTDWPGNNIKYWRHNSDTARWRWIAYDTDFGFGIWDANDFNNNTLAFALNPNGPDWPNPPWSTLFLRKLMANQEFKYLFINTFADQLNTSFLPSVVKEKISHFKSLIESEIGSHMNRWYGNVNYWNQKMDELVQYAEQRPPVVREHIKSYFNIDGTYQVRLRVSSSSHGEIKINSIIPGQYSWTGIYFNGIPITLTAMPKPGYRFVRWEGDLNSTDETVTMTFNSNVVIQAVFEESDSRLNSIVINEINYNSQEGSDAGDWVELYNKGSQAINLSDWILKDNDDSNEFIFPANTTINSGEYLVVCRDQNDFTSVFPEVSNYIGDMGFGLSSDGDCVRLFTDDGIQVDIVCFEPTSPWPEEANGNGSTLALKHYNYDNADAANWYALANNGNPGEDNSQEITGLDDIIRESSLMIYPNPFNENMTIRYFLPESGKVSLLFYDNKGRLITSLFQGAQNRGQHEFYWDGADMVRPGIYFLKFTHQNGVVTEKLVVH